MGRVMAWVAGIRAAAAAVAGGAVAAGAEQPAAAKLELQRVALFKNGLGMFTAELALPEQGTQFVFRPPVAASHGTFWVSAGPQVRLGSLVASRVSVGTDVPATSVAEFLAANVGRQVTLQMSGESRDTIEGKWWT